MTRALLSLISITACALSLLSGPAHGDPPTEPSPIDEQTKAGTSDGSVTIDRRIVLEGDRQTRDASSRESESTDVIGAFCADATADAIAGAGASQTIVYLCHGFAPLPVAQRRDLIRRAFKELPLYRGAIRTDPPTFTLVNLVTYFWCADGAGRTCTTIGEGERRITLLGQQVRIRPRIIAYSWDFGDGTGQQITDRKANHTYRHAEPATVTLTLTWTADYALGGGSFQPINDTTTTTSPPRLLPIREAQAVIVGG